MSIENVDFGNLLKKVSIDIELIFLYFKSQLLGFYK